MCMLTFFVVVFLSLSLPQFKLCRVTKQESTTKSIPYIVTHDGRTIRYPDPAARVLDTVRVDIASGKITDVYKFEVGNKAMITKGHNTGRVGVITARDRHLGSFDIVHVRDATGETFATRLENVFVIGKGDSTDITLPKGDGIKKSIMG